MKNICLLSLFFFFSGFAFSQNNTVRDTGIMYDEKVRPALTFKMDAEDERSLKKELKKYYRKRHDLKLSRKKDFWVAEEITVLEISSKEADFIVELAPAGVHAVNCTAAYRFGYDYYINPDDYPNEYRAFKEFFLQFIREYLTEYYGELMAESKKELDKAADEKNDLLKENKKLLKRNKKIEKKIHKYQKKSTKKPKKSEIYRNKIAVADIEILDNFESMGRNRKRIDELQDLIIRYTNQVNEVQEKINSIP